jgi:hypothetical protein
MNAKIIGPIVLGEKNKTGSNKIATIMHSQSLVKTMSISKEI